MSSEQTEQSEPDQPAATVDSAETDGAPSARTPPQDSRGRSSFRQRVLVGVALLVVPGWQFVTAEGVSLARFALGAVVFGGLVATLELTWIGERLRERATDIEAGRERLVLAFALAASLAIAFVAVLAGFAFTAVLDRPVPIGTVLLSIIFLPVVDPSGTFGGLLAAVAVDLYASYQSRGTTP